MGAEHPLSGRPALPNDVEAEMKRPVRVFTELPSCYSGNENAASPKTAESTKQGRCRMACVHAGGVSRARKPMSDAAQDTCRFHAVRHT